MSNDILQDLKERLEAIGFNDPKIEKVIFETRSDWAGERPYISVKIDIDKKMSERNRAIMLDYKKGESVIFLSRRHHLSRKRIYEILKEYGL
jgi:Mor family transcriptional regulator